MNRNMANACPAGQDGQNSIVLFSDDLRRLCDT